jgi:hypothetical protein
VQLKIQTRNVIPHFISNEMAQNWHKKVQQHANLYGIILPGNVFVSSLSSARVRLSFDVHWSGDQRSLQACKIKVEVCWEEGERSAILEMNTQI